jgi:hypothetical protein
MRPRVLSVISLGLVLASALKAQPLPDPISGGDLWPATDALGRTLPDAEEVGPPRPHRTVALFYFLWHNQHSKSGPFNISEILAEHPGAMTDPALSAWGPPGAYHHFAEPLFGYYRSTDEWVYRKHAEMLADAGVDVIVFDATNGYTYKDSYLALCRAFSQAQKDGVRVPKIAFLCRFGPVDPAQVEGLYNDFYKPGLFKNLWFHWKGKPLIMAYPEGTSDEVRDFFTFRPGMASYFTPPSRKDQWGWLEVSPQHGFGGTKDQPEEMTVGVAMNAHADQLTTLSDPRSMGRSFHNGHADPRPEAFLYGLNFQEQWDHALKADPELVFITGWNEWVAMRLNKFAGYEAPVVFVDTFDLEKSRDIEPMKGGYGDNYYYQMVANIRRFKGMNSPPPAGPEKSIAIDGDFSEWTDVGPEFSDYRGDTGHRDAPGWGETLRYVNTQGRNDIISCKVARDRTHLYFYVKTAGTLSDPNGPHGMQLFLDTDRRHDTGWEGYDFLLSRQGRKSVLEKSAAGGGWKTVAGADCQIKDGEMEVAIPRAALNLPEGTRIDLEFKWVDNPERPDDIMGFYTCGDAAPGERFNYRYFEAEK